jgi:hypothetical protein
MAKALDLIDTGRKGWESGAPMPPMPQNHDEYTPEALYWVGYMLRRAQDLFERRGMALYPDTIKPRP